MDDVDVIMTGRVAARLLRVSRGTQFEENQAQPTAEYIARRGMIEGPVFRLRGKSAAKGTQVAAIRNAIAAHKRGEFEVLVIRAIDRLDRRGIRQGWALIGELLDAGIPVVSVADPELERAPVDPMAEMQVSLKLGMAKQEITDKIRRVMDGFQVIDAGASFRGKVPWGYVTAGEKKARYLVPGPAAEQLRDACDRAINGESLVSISRHTGRALEGLRNALHNPVYWTGEYKVTRADGSVAIHRMEPLISRETYERVAASLESRSKGGGYRPRSSRQGEPVDLSGVLRCGACRQGVLYRHPTRPGKGQKTYYYFRCFIPVAIRRELGDLTQLSCGRTISLTMAQAAVDQVLGALAAEESERVFVPGDGSGQAVRKIEDELRALPSQGLSDEEEDAERTRLRAMRDQLKKQKGQKSGWKTRLTGRTWGQAWEARSVPERVAWLKTGVLTVYVSKRVTGPLRAWETDVNGVVVDVEYED
jgi:resolvase-like protein